MTSTPRRMVRMGQHVVLAAPAAHGGGTQFCVAHLAGPQLACFATYAEAVRALIDLGASASGVSPR